MKEVKFFCERLFKDLDSLIQGRDISKLYNIIAETLDKEISESKVLNVIKAMKNNRSSRSEGFTAEFYITSFGML